MQQSNLPSSIRDRIPEYVIESYPIFVEFVQAYYAYAYQRKAGVGAIQGNSLDSDIDTTLDEYVDEFYGTYGKYLPKTIASDKRNFVKLLNSIYSAKGTENALKLLFQGVFGERVSVSYPGQSILRGSDGKWIQERFFTASTIYGELPSEFPYDVVFGNSFGDFRVQVSKIDSTDPSSTRFYFDTLTSVSVEPDQTFTVYDLTGSVVWAGQLVPTPGDIQIKTGGQNWQVGQVVIIPGSIKNTVAKVTRVNAVGTILSLEVLENGVGHTIGQTVFVSPYPSKPPHSTSNTTTVQTSYSPDVYHHTINLVDYTNGFDETINGSHVSTELGTLTFTEIYAQSDVTNGSTGSGEFTYEQWLNSRAMLTYVAQDIVKVRGYYANFDGQLSNQEIRTQDNYFYQAFSYVIETTKEIDTYKDLLPVVHPAGTKLFANLVKQVDYQFDFTVSRTLSADTLYLISSVTPEDTNTLHFDKVIDDLVDIVESVNIWLNKTIADSVYATSLDNASIAYDEYAKEGYAVSRYSAYDATLTVG